MRGWIGSYVRGFKACGAGAGSGARTRTGAGTGSARGLGAGSLITAAAGTRVRCARIARFTRHATNAPKK